MHLNSMQNNMGDLPQIIETVTQLEDQFYSVLSRMDPEVMNKVRGGDCR